MITQDNYTQSGLFNQMVKKSSISIPNGEISSRMKSERKRLGANQIDFAQAMDTALGSYVRYEQGIRSVPSDKLLALEGIGADAAFILTGKRSEASLEEAFHSLEPEALQAVKTIVELLVKK